MTYRSLVLAVPPAEPEENLAYLAAKLSFYTDAWDVAEDLRHGVDAIVVIDARSEQHYLAGHIPGAVSLPHRLMDEVSTAALDRDKVYITYCDGIGCNASTQGAYKLARLGFKVKELLGGLDFWLRDGYPVAVGESCGSLMGQQPGADCGCA
ncbi:rhodanese [Serratia sp. JUb9]|uniref:rhodanese-like domain-containing protein n=1 Tax=unclassified Serratia (in: enterobacteria) TaxID=2647522 RepID=UPI00164D924F|nr:MULTISPECIES: rhodanese-like domain-containing protein [unclassified Serratia (in: enterobacteria)]MBU3892008.1 rhodanese [Serratia rubidaea]MCA4822604.1 rhodanese [Serratia rubidaea]QNK33860.1 rhodanese [Serratia sp. JUb9]CAE1148348.1 Molybdopterin biosynthesis protein MoeB [Serratia sp. Tan611]